LDLHAAGPIVAPLETGDERIDLIAPGKTFTGNFIESWRACRKASARSWPQESRRGDAGRRHWLAPARQRGHIATGDARLQRFRTGGLDGGQPVIEHPSVTSRQGKLIERGDRR
jgi:hypothetical protein